MCERQHRVLRGSADHLREPARRHGRGLAPTLAALEATEFARLPRAEAELLRASYGLAGSRPFTQAERAGRFGLTIWQVRGAVLKARLRYCSPPKARPR